MGNCWPKPVDLPVTPAPSSGSYKPAGFKRRKPDAVESHQNRNLNVQPLPPSAAVVVVAEAPTLPLPPPATGNDSVNSLAVASSSGSSSSYTSPRTMKKFSYGELRTATRNFRPDTMLGEGGFGRVFKGWVDEKTYAPSKVGIGIPVAVKKSNPDSEQGLNEWQMNRDYSVDVTVLNAEADLADLLMSKAEVRFLGKFSHPNLVKLIGYCWEEREFLLVYEYMQRGSLESHLFRRGAETLSWEIRLKIMVDAARGLDFLHSTEKQVIYRDFKASNILLDLDFNAKLSDFGLAKLGPVNGDSHITTQVVGTYGYAAPEYMATGHLYVKSDVYGFGVVLLEILSGRRVLDTNRPAGELNLVDWAKPLLPEKRRLRQLMDPQLEGQYPLKAVTQIAELILNCLEPDPKKRPGMDEVLDTLLRVSSIQVKPKAQSSKEAQKKQKKPGHRHHHHPSPPLLRSKNPSDSSMAAQARHKLPMSNRSY